jgi:hypothetical protein
MNVSKVAFSNDELAALDKNRGHYSRAAFLRSAGLQQKLHAALPTEIATTWGESARVQACFTQINEIAKPLNEIRKHDGSAAAAAELLAESASILAAFKKFRAVVLGGAGRHED